jgi:hypothetical protein
VSGLTVKLTGDWSEIRRLLLVGQFQERVREGVGIATGVNAFVVRREIRDNVRKGLYADNRAVNAVLTTKIKRSTKPLVDSGHLFKAITSVQTDWHTAEVGVLRGDPNANIAEIVHEGRLIEVTQSMRALFAMLAEASNGSIDPSKLTGRAQELFARMPRNWKALRPTTTHIRIPPRPYIREVVESDGVNKLCGKNWMTGIVRATAGLPVTQAHMDRKV